VAGAVYAPLEVTFPIELFPPGIPFTCQEIVDDLPAARRNCFVWPALTVTGVWLEGLVPLGAAEPAMALAPKAKATVMRAGMMALLNKNVLLSQVTKRLQTLRGPDRVEIAGSTFSQI
jgi:hypothetical protein